MMTDMVTMRFTNRDALGPGMNTQTCVDEMVVHKDACVRIAKWYGGYHAGDDYTLEIDGVAQELDLNGELVP